MIVVLAGCGVRNAETAQQSGRSAASDPHSGIRGQVLLGPTCPVERPGQSCVRPYRATISVTNATTGRVVARVRSGANGFFAVALAAGRYMLVPQSGRPFPRARSQPVIVHPRRYTRVVIQYDTGIR
jgi:hypothetical protein